MENGHKTSEVSSKYLVNYEDGLIGMGGFANVYLAVNKITGEEVALKKIDKSLTDSNSFLKEMKSLLQVKAYGGHPHISGLIDFFEEEEHFIVILDLVKGGEMFDHLVELGAYSEADASRFLREVASALAFVHGINVIHADLKPEHLMLSNSNASDAVVKLVDFGCAEVLNCVDNDFILQSLSKKESSLYTQSHEAIMTESVITPAYATIEVLRGEPKVFSTDLFALGIIVYVMLTGVHPFDVDGDATDEQIACNILNKNLPPLRDSSITAHLSHSAVDLIDRLMDWDDKTRLTAQEVLEHPWIKGSTATTEIMVDSHKKLSMFRTFQSHLEAKVFANIISVSSKDEENICKRTTLLEVAFQNLDTDKKGFLKPNDIVNDNLPGSPSLDTHNDNGTFDALSLSEFSNLLSQNMKSVYFPTNKIIYFEGDVGHHLYFINSGVVEVSTMDGSLNKRYHGDFFGEGALFTSSMTRSATVKCVTPVHTIQVSREYMNKYLSKDSNLKVDMREKNKLRKRDRAKSILQLQSNLKTLHFNNGDHLFQEGEDGDELYILEEGTIDVTINGSTVFTIKHKGDICGEYSLIMNKPRNAGAVCTSDACKVSALKRSDFETLLDLSNSSKKSLREMCLRREVRKALVTKTRKDFPSVNDLFFMFDAANTTRSGDLTIQEIKDLLFLLDPAFSDDDTNELLNSMDLKNQQDAVTFQEFTKIFGMEA